jgi:hypothetical protein
MIFSLLFDEELANENYAKQRTWILKRLERAGQIAGSRVDWMEFYKALRPTEKQIWKELLSTHPNILMKSVKEIQAMDEPELLQKSKDCPIVVALGRSQADRFGVTEDGGLPSRRDQVEFIEISDLALSEFCSIKSRTFPAGTSREMVSQKLLIPLIRRSTSLIIVDPYILDSLEVGEVGTSTSNFYWMIDSIGSVRAEVEYAITLFTSYEKSDYLRDELVAFVGNVMEGISRVFPKMRLQFVIAPRSSFRSLDHDRYWRLLHNGETRQMVKFSNSINAFQHRDGKGFKYDISINELEPEPGQSWKDFVEYYKVIESRIENLAAMGGVIYASKQSG